MVFSKELLSKQHKLTFREWLQVLLDICALEKGLTTKLRWYYDVTSDGKIVCEIRGEDFDISNKEEFEKIAGHLVSVETVGMINNILKLYPEIFEAFTPDEDLVVEFIYDYGTGAAKVAEWKNGKIA